ncbi:MAG: helix-hairpin-helix domain-containing protein [bacterium]|jgi:competence ComEA-like helix-hairpin-helix protein
MKTIRFAVLLTAFVAVAIIAASPVYAMVKININTASERRLEQLPGIGENIAELIVSYRKEIGFFKSVSELKNVPGIGEKRYKALEYIVTVGPLFENGR